jgi:hypothetical protein
MSYRSIEEWVRGCTGGGDPRTIECRVRHAQCTQCGCHNRPARVTHIDIDVAVGLRVANLQDEQQGFLDRCARIHRERGVGIRTQIGSAWCNGARRDVRWRRRRAWGPRPGWRRRRLSRQRCGRRWRRAQRGGWRPRRRPGRLKDARPRWSGQGRAAWRLGIQARPPGRRRQRRGTCCAAGRRGWQRGQSGQPLGIRRRGWGPSPWRRRNRWRQRS